MKDQLLDLSIYYSFDARGFKRHAINFQKLQSLSPQQKILITGGTSGIGLGVVKFVSSFDAEIFVTGRDEKKGQSLKNKMTNFYKIDLADWKNLIQFAEDIPGQLDALVFNAGGMPDEFIKNEQGYEYQCASQLIGHYLLFRKLHDLGKIKAGAKIIFVSSGGMFLKKLDLNELFNPQKYDKVSAYANVKRAQVILTEVLAKEQNYQDYIFASMHPGWVDTVAVSNALPGFYQLTQKHLRRIEEGSDTINFLISEKEITSGNFWFDRKISNPNPVVLAWTRSSAEEKNKLLFNLENIYNCSLTMVLKSS
jgi:dehydrogenase/reductase SDR family protein 12